MASNTEASLKSTPDIWRHLLRLTYAELNVYRHLAHYLASQNPGLDLQKSLEGLRENENIRAETEKQFAKLEEVLAKLDSLHSDAAIAAFQKWIPPDGPLN